VRKHLRFDFLAQPRRLGLLVYIFDAHVGGRSDRICCVEMVRSGWQPVGTGTMIELQGYTRMKFGNAELQKSVISTSKEWTLLQSRPKCEEEGKKVPSLPKEWKWYEMKATM